MGMRAHEITREGARARFILEGSWPECSQRNARPDARFAEFARWGCGTPVGERRPNELVERATEARADTEREDEAWCKWRWSR
eukprot:3799585-Pleurochrysis_carterae.AAC.2